MSDTELQRDEDQVQPFADQGAALNGVDVETVDGALGSEGNETPDSVVELRQKVDALEDQLLRTKAEHQNILRRAGTERIEAVRYANADLMRAIIPVLDDLDRAIEAAAARPAAEKRKPSAIDPALLDGVKLVRENLLKALREQGMELIAAQHQAFDPHLHEAMMRQPSDEFPAGTVLQELAKGYRLRERTLRPARVIVSQGPAS